MFDNVNRYYVCRDYQGGEFGMNRDYDCLQWLEQAKEWANSDESYGIVKENKCELYFKKLTCYFDYEAYKSNEYCKIKNPTLAEDTQPTDYIRWEETYLATSEEEYNKMIEEN